MSDLELRPSVKRFAEVMESKLRVNDHRGGWDNCNSQWLLAKVMEELGELLQAQMPAEIAEEAADAANYLMMYVEVKNRETANAG